MLLSLTITNVQTEVASKHHITENTFDIFIEAFSSTTPLSRFSVNDFVHHFNSKIAKVIDAIAPTNVKVVLVRKNLLGRMPRWSKWKKSNVKKQSAGGNKQISRLILKLITDLTFSV